MNYINTEQGYTPKGRMQFYCVLLKPDSYTLSYLDCVPRGGVASESGIKDDNISLCVNHNQLQSPTICVLGLQFSYEKNYKPL